MVPKVHIRANRSLHSGISGNLKDICTSHNVGPEDCPGSVVGRSVQSTLYKIPKGMFSKNIPDRS